MSSLLRSSRSKLFSSSSASLSRTFSALPRPTGPLDSRSPLTPPRQIGSLPPVFELFHRNTATTSLANENPSKGNLTGLPKPSGGEFGKLYGLLSLNDPVNKLRSDSNKMNPLRYKASGLDNNLLAGAGYGTRVWAAKGPVILGVNAVMAKSFERSAVADTLGLTGHKRFMSDVPSKTSETKPYGIRPLSPHLPLYQPQLSSTLSIFNRIAGAFLASIVLAFYIIYMKLGLISLTYDSFYQFIFYSSKLHLLAVEISALALSYHLYSAIRHLLI